MECCNRKDEQINKLQKGAPNDKKGKLEYLFSRTIWEGQEAERSQM